MTIDGLDGVTRAFAPGRVNLIGEHTDYTDGLVLPMALDMGIEIAGTTGGDRLRLRSTQQEHPIDIAVPVEGDITSIEPAWGRFIAGVALHLGLGIGFDGTVTSSLPAGGTGLSSSAALTCAALLALGGDGDRKAMAQAARKIENEAVGVQSGLMDQLASLFGVAGHALLIDCGSLEVSPVVVPDSMEVLVLHSGQPRLLADSEYNARRESCIAIEAMIGPLREAALGQLDEIGDATLRRRARHVITENGRVMAMVEALAAEDLKLVGEILAEGHRSLAEDYETSTAIVDAQVARVAATPGVYGVRMTGGGFGGSLVAVCEPGTDLDIEEWWTRAHPGPGAWVESS